jgi:hypothetical protein
MRQLRLTTFDQIKGRLKEFTGKKINIVLRDRRVLFGELVRIDEKHLTFTDMREKRISLLLHEISEVYLDFKE